MTIGIQLFSLFRNSVAALVWSGVLAIAAPVFAVQDLHPDTGSPSDRVRLNPR